MFIILSLNQEMAPTIQVPCNFGRECINIPEHCNLKLKLKNGEDYLVNSVIMSYNSPEIKRLTTELHQTTLDMDDIDENAVYCFVDALYSGELELIKKDIFTDVYKLGRVFTVQWLLLKCTDYYGSLVAERETIDASSGDTAYENLKSLFLIARAIHTESYLKERIFIDFLVKSINERGDKREFIKTFVGDIKLNELSESLAGQILHIVGGESDILVEGLVRSLRSRPFDTPLSDELRNMLENCSLATCYQKSRETYDELFDLLDEIESLTKDDLKFINRINRQCMKKAFTLILDDLNIPSENVTVPSEADTMQDESKAMVENVKSSSSASYTTSPDNAPSPTSALSDVD